VFGAAAARSLVVSGLPLPPDRRLVRSPLGEDQLRPPEAEVTTIQFCTPLSERELVRLAAFMREYPSLGLYVYAQTSEPPVPDLEFLRHFSFLRSLGIGRWTVTNFEGLRHLRPSNLTHLSINEVLRGRIPLAAVAPFTNLESLSIDGPSKDFGALTALQNLRSVHLRSLKVPTLRPLAALPRLREVTLTLGGTTALDELANVAALDSLELTMIRGLSDLSALAEIRSLELLRLRALKHVTALPSLRRLERLREVHLDQLRALRDVRGIADAPALETFSAVMMQNVPPEVFEPLAAHPALRSVQIGLRPARANARVHAMFAHLAERNAPGRRQ
jgi:internalin A